MPGRFYDQKLMVIAVSMAFIAMIAPAMSTMVAVTMSAALVSAMIAVIAMKLIPATAMITMIIMAGIPVPMITVSFVAAIADHSLVMTTTVARIPCTVKITAFPWITLIYHYFISMIYVIIAISFR